MLLFRGVFGDSQRVRRFGILIKWRPGTKLVRATTSGCSSKVMKNMERTVYARSAWFCAKPVYQLEPVSKRTIRFASIHPSSASPDLFSLASGEACRATWASRPRQRARYYFVSELRTSSSFQNRREFVCTSRKLYDRQGTGE
uniref:Uncharacterized protein n=1 Tax=Strigamia maritima TaxID=126957 RepID=T1IN48_STRMM